MGVMPYFDVDEDEEFGFFSLANEIWAAADERRDSLVEQHGDDLGRWLADIRQYKAAWWGDVWQPEARRAENHIAFSTFDDWDFWDHDAAGIAVVHCRDDNGELQPDGSMQWRSQPATYSIAGGRLVG